MIFNCHFLKKPTGVLGEEMTTVGQGVKNTFHMNGKIWFSTHTLQPSKFNLSAIFPNIFQQSRIKKDQGKAAEPQGGAWMQGSGGGETHFPTDNLFEIGLCVCRWKENNLPRSSEPALPKKKKICILLHNTVCFKGAGAGESPKRLFPCLPPPPLNQTVDFICPLNDI